MNLIGKTLLASAAVAAMSGGAMAADLAMPAPAAPVIAAPAPTNWDGPYIGANIGYGWGSSDHNDINTTIGDFNLNGWGIGGQIGYNFHLSDAVVAGVQADIEWASISGSQTPFGPGATISDTINWTGALTARLGYDVDGFLPYVLGGVAFANNSRTDFTGTSESQTQTGWTVGAGVETMLADHLSGFAEYRYSDYGSATYSNLLSTPGVHLTDSSIRVGLNYHF